MNKTELNNATAPRSVDQQQACSALREDRDDECDHKLSAFEEAARHLDELAEDLERGMEKTCLIKVAASIRSTGRLAYGHPLVEPPSHKREPTNHK